MSELISDIRKRAERGDVKAAAEIHTIFESRCTSVAFEAGAAWQKERSESRAVTIVALMFVVFLVGALFGQLSAVIPLGQ